MKKYLAIAAFFGLFIILAGTFVAVNLLQRREGGLVTPKAAPSTTLSLSPATSTQYVSHTFTIDVRISSGTNLVVSCDIVLTYNPAILEAVDIVSGGFIPATEIQKKIDNTGGKITYSFYTFSANAKQGNGSLAQVTFKAKAPGNTSVAFDPLTAVGALGEAQNVLTGTTPATITVQYDTTAPAAITDLRSTGTTMNTISLAWTAPSDVGPEGKAQSYDLRYSTSQISDANWSSATAVTTGTPQAPGAQETLTVSGLTAGTTYYFGLKSKDASNNISSLSNIATAATVSRPSLSFQIKFQGITTQKPNELVTVTLRQGATTKYTFSNLSTTANASGIYSGTVTDIDPGTYDVFVKGRYHLQEKFPSVTLNPGPNSYNWTSVTMRAGDIDGSNFINSVDIGRVIEDYFPDTPAGSPADLNLDGTVNSVDIGFVIENYFQEGAK